MSGNRLDFDYARPRRLKDAVEEFTHQASLGNTPAYFAGGTEIITLTRVFQMYTKAVIDLKGILTNHILQLEGGQLRIGATRTLTELAEDPFMEQEFPLLGVTVREIADRTARNKITLGGNICGQIFYREAVLPLLLCESRIVIAGPSGVREVPIRQAFKRTLLLQQGEFLVHILTEEALRKAPYIHVKRRKIGNVGYPVLTAAAICQEHRMRVAFSGLYPYPFRSTRLESALNDAQLSRPQRIEAAIRTLQEEAVLDDVEASRDFRLFVLRTVLGEILQKWGNERV